MTAPGNHWDGIRAALEEAKSADRAVRAHALQMARLLVGRLDELPDEILADLKRELRAYNIARRRWAKPR